MVFHGYLSPWSVGVVDHTVFRRWLGGASNLQLSSAMLTQRDNLGHSSYVDVGAGLMTDADLQELLGVRCTVFTAVCS